MVDLIIFSVPQCPNGNYLSNYCLKQGWGFNPVAVTTMPNIISQGKVFLGISNQIIEVLSGDIKPLVSSSSMINREAGYGKCPGAPRTSKKLSLVISRIKGMGLIHRKLFLLRSVINLHLFNRYLLVM